MVIDRFPSWKSEEAMKQFMQQDRLPDIIKSWEIYTVADGTRGIKVYNLIKVDKGDADDAYIEIAKIMNKVCQIEGRTWKIEPVLGATDTMKAFSAD